MEKTLELVEQYAWNNTNGVNIGAGWWGGITMNNQKVSLRGTLASEFLHAMLDIEAPPEEVNEYITRLASVDDPTIMKVRQRGVLLIGKAAERGRFLPDW